MREAHPTERAVGVRHYVSDEAGIGGRLRDRPADFRVRELESFATEPVDAAAGSYPCVVVRATLSAWDTNDFARRLSDALGVSRERVSWAGTKDKYAVTTQLFSVRGLDMEGVERLRDLDVRDADIEVVGRAGRDIDFGDLAGNDFEVTVREPAASEHVPDIVATLRSFAGDGSDGVRDDEITDETVAVPNYFGQQRFGSKRPVTHEVGLHAVRGEWREAVLAYVGNPADTEPSATREARQRVDEEAASESPDWDAALEAFPGRLRFERSMLHRLVEREPAPDAAADWRYALAAVPENLQRLFVNAAQSYAFNEILSRRLARGLPFHRPVEGDVCCFADSDRGNGNDADGLPAQPDADRQQRATSDRVDVLARHCERGRAFVTAPLVGTETELAGGEPGDIEREVLAELSLSPADFDLPEDWGSRGTRRAVLVETDLTVAGDPPTFWFALPSGSYATVLLREFLKAEPAAMS
ncbi:MAG: tRNA pseudouridine(13) synthase TruD [Halolamina sp.]